LGVEIGLVVMSGEKGVLGDFFYGMFNTDISEIGCKKNEEKWWTHSREFPFIKCTLFFEFVVSLNCWWPCLVTPPCSFDS